MLHDHETRLVQARAAYLYHRIDQESEGRWLLRSYRNGWEHAGYTEIISLYGGQLFVGGDYDPVVFAYYSGKDHDAKVRWMGSHVLDHYVAEKAVIGTGRDAIYGFHAQHAADCLREALAVHQEESSEDLTDLVEAVDYYIRSLGSYTHTESSAMIKLHEDLSGVRGADSFLDDFHFAPYYASRLYHAHAALQRLCLLLDARAAGNVLFLGGTL